MASLFLSYAREDVAKARLIAAALEEAGHSVWWDRHLRGGSEFSEEIEEALNGADFVIVLWSARSIKSAWVRDEAAAGRDRGCLVPVLIEAVRPPMGFRQYQGIDLTGRSEQRRREALDSLISAVDPSPGTARRASRAQSFTLPKLPARAIFIAVAITALIAAGYWIWRSTSTRSNQIVAIVPADAASRQLAQAMLVNLAALPSAQRGSVTLVADQGSKRTADLIFRAAASGPTAGSLTLVAGKTGGILWSKQFDASDANLAQRQSFAAGKALECTVEALTGGGPKVGDQLLKVYLNACANIGEIGWDKTPVVNAMREVTAAAPNFAAAWGKLLIAEIDSLGTGSDSGLGTASRRQLAADIIAARRVDPQLAEATMAEAALQTMPPIAPVLQLIDRANAQNPASEPILSQRAILMQLVGRFREAIADARRATELDPMSAEVRSNYILVLAYAGQLDLARREMAAAKRVWPEANTLKQTEQSLEVRFGDFERAIRSGALGNGPGAGDYVAMRRDPSETNVRRFFARTQRIAIGPDQLSFALQAFSEVGRPDLAYAILDRAPAGSFSTENAYILFRPTMKSFRDNPRFIALAVKLGLVDYWRTSGLWADFCEDPQLPYDCRAEAAKLG